MDSITDSMEINLSKKHLIVKDRGSWRAAIHGVAKSQTRLSDSTTRTRVDQLFKKVTACNVNVKSLTLFSNNS